MPTIRVAIEPHPFIRGPHSTGPRRLGRTTRFDLTSFGNGPVNQIHDDGTYVWFTCGSKLLRYSWANEQASFFADISAGVSIGFGEMRFRVTTDGVYTSFGKVLNSQNGDLLGTWMPVKPSLTSSTDRAAVCRFTWHRPGFPSHAASAPGGRSCRTMDCA